MHSMEKESRYRRHAHKSQLERWRRAGCRRVCGCRRCWNITMLGRSGSDDICRAGGDSGAQRQIYTDVRRPQLTSGCRGLPLNLITFEEMPNH